MPLQGCRYTTLVAIFCLQALGAETPHNISHMRVCFNSKVPRQSLRSIPLETRLPQSLQNGGPLRPAADDFLEEFWFRAWLPFLERMLRKMFDSIGNTPASISSKRRTSTSSRRWVCGTVLGPGPGSCPRSACWGRCSRRWSRARSCSRRRASWRRCLPPRSTPAPAWSPSSRSTSSCWRSATSCGSLPSPAPSWSSCSAPRPAAPVTKQKT